MNNSPNDIAYIKQFSGLILGSCFFFRKKVVAKIEKHIDSIPGRRCNNFEIRNNQNSEVIIMPTESNKIIDMVFEIMREKIFRKPSFQTDCIGQSLNFQKS